jgi:hypothetical protein
MGDMENRGGKQSEILEICAGFPNPFSPKEPNTKLGLMAIVGK